MLESVKPEPQAGGSAPPRRRWVQALLGAALVTVIILVAWYLTSPRFNEYIRAKVVAEIENATGGRVELKALRWDLSELTFEVDDLTIHGLESPSELPYAHVDRLIGRAKIISLFRRDVGLRELQLYHPVIHLITYPDGSTNQPKPKIRSESGKAPVDSIFELAIERAQAHDGVLVLNDRALPFDFNASGLQAGMTFAQPDQRYDATLHADKVDAQLKDMRPISAVVDAQLSLFPKRAQIKTLTASTGRSQLTASGTIDDFNHPKIALTYNGKVNLGELGGILRVTQLHAGVAEIKGQGTFTEPTFSSNGSVAVKQVEYADPIIQLHNFVATADYRMDPASLALDNIVARVFDGDIKGSATVHNWRSGPSVTGKLQQQGTGSFKIAGVSVGEVVRAFSTRDLPLSAFNFAGSASGDGKTTWKGSVANTLADLALDLTPPAQLSPGQLPVTGQAKGTIAIATGRAELLEVSVASRASRLTASGSLGQRNANIKVNATSSDLGEVKPFLAALKQDQLPLDVHGSASFSGTISGTLKLPNIAGHAEIRDFDSVFASLPAAPTAPQLASTAPPRSAKLKRIHWDSLTADLDYSATQLTIRNGVLRRGTAHANVEGFTSLTKGRYTDTSVFDVRVNLRNAEIADAQSLLGLSYPVSGTIDLKASISGSQQDLRGSGHVLIANGTIRGETVKQLTSDIRFANQEAQLTNIDLAHNGSHITGSAAYNLTSKAFRFDLASTGIDLASIRELHSRIPLRGMLSFSARGSGTQEQPVINAHVRLSNMFSGDEKLGDITADVVTTGDTAKVTGRSNFQNSDLRLDGNVRLRGDFPAQLTLQANQVNLDPLLRSYIKGQITAHSRLAGTIVARGPLNQPKQMTATGSIQQLSAEVEHVGIRNDGPIEFALENQVITIRRMRLIGENTELTATGKIDLAGGRRMDVRADGQVNMRLLQTFNPDFRSEGLVTVNARATGSLAQPAIFGTLKITNGALSYIDLPNGLADVNGTLAFNQDRLQIQQLTARTGGGTLDLGGFITYGRNVSFNITATAKDMRLRYPPGVSSQADADLRLTGTLKASVLSGDIVVTKFGVNPRFDFALYLARAKQPPQAPNPDSLLNNLRLDVHITSTPELQVQTSLAKISGNADLRVRGSGTRPSLLGRVSIIEGDVFFNGTKYHLERGDITFTNPVRIEPVMDMEATTTVRNYDITLGFHGRMDALSVNYRSDPPLSSSDIIQLLAFGRTQEEMAQQSATNSNFTESASNAILSQALNAAVSSRVQKLFGVTRVKVDPRIGGAENNPSGARVTVEQQVANNLTITYITDLTRSTQQVIQVEYNINRNLSLTAIRDENGVVGVDIRFRQRKR